MSEASVDKEKLPDGGGKTQDVSDVFGRLLEEPRLQEFKGNYELHGIIGRGGYAEIWVAKDLQNKRTVAVKSLREDKVEDQQARNAFIQEARLMLYLQHPGIVPVYDFFKDSGGRLHIIMKLVLGRTLDDLLNQAHEEYKGKTPREIESRERVQMAERLKIFLKVCDMVAYAHEKHVLHRDLKPANIMLGKQDDVYVMDWGIAEPHESDEPIQAPEDTTGTVCYLAPEIIRRKKYDERSDVYSLGLVLFDLVYLHPAFVQMDEHLTCYYAVRGKTSHRKHEYGYRVPNWLRLVIDHAIWLDQDKRTPSVTALMEQIRRGMAYDASLWGRLKRLIGL